MLDPAIAEFFEGRKEDWLKKKAKASMGEAEIKALNNECDQHFSLENWMPNAAKRAGQISIATHPCTFSHPSARKNKNGYVSSIIADVKSVNNGYLISGNVAAEKDALGNAAALDVYKFLTLIMDDGVSLLEHIQNDSELSQKLLKINSTSYQKLKQDFLAMVSSDSENITSSKVKQVFFPVDNGYHQLSLLTNSGISYQLRKRLDALRFSDQVKEQRELKKKNDFSDNGYSEIYNLTTIGYGGTKPQNISVLNNQNGGKTHLLNSLPPQLQKRQVHFPKSNFFKESFPQFEYFDVLQALHKLIKTDYNNVNIREGRDYRIQELIDRILIKMWLVRAVANNQYHADSSRLNAHQKIWLCEDQIEMRENSDDWLEKLLNEISTWVIRTYENRVTKQKTKLGEQERLKVVELLEQNKEAFR